jgi:hypothetical protein
MVTLTVEPESWFVEYAQHQRVRRNGRDYSARLTDNLKEMVTYTQQRLGENHTRLDVRSLAVQYALDRPYLDWDVNAMHFEGVAEAVSQQKLKGEYVGWMSPVGTDWEKKITTDPKPIRIPQQSAELFEAIQEILKCDASELIRFCLGVAFAWFDREVFHGEELEAAREQFQRYVDVMRDQLEYRTERASAQFDAF